MLEDLGIDWPMTITPEIFAVSRGATETGSCLLQVQLAILNIVYVHL